MWGPRKWISTQERTVALEFAHLSNVLLRRHRLQIIHEAGVDMRVEVHILGLVRGPLRGVVLADPKPIEIFWVLVWKSK